MNQNTRRPLPAGIGAILTAAIAASLAGEDAKVPGMTVIELDGEGSIDEQMKRAIEAGAARHRETCAACREAHEAMQPKTASSTGHDALRERQKELHDAECKSLADQHAVQREHLKRGQDDELVGMTKRHAAEREKLEASLAQADDAGERGFMFFLDGEPVIESFSLDRGVLEDSLAILVDAEKTSAFQKLGLDMSGDYEIREVTRTTTTVHPFA